MTYQSTYTGQRGRKKLTDAQREGKSARKKSPDMVVDSVLPVPPEALDPDAAAEWNRVGEYLLLTRRVSKLDVQSLMVYCTSYVMYANAIRPLIRGRRPIWGLVNGRPKPAKVVDVAYEHGMLVLEMARRFGMTARTRHMDHKLAGRPALPSEIHALRGAGRSVRPYDSLPAWPESAIAKPDWLNDPVASREWERLTGVLQSLDLWTPLDVSIIAISCGSYSLLCKCAQEQQSQPLVVTGENSEVAVEHPLSIIYRKHFDLCSSIWQDYGMTPHDRMRFHHVEGEQQGKAKLKIYVDEA